VSIVTRGGDGGETGLLYGGRVPKDDLRTEAYGALDEAISAMGLARALTPNAKTAALLLEVQRECFTVGAELATAKEDRDKLTAHFPVLEAAAVLRLDALVVELEAAVPLPKGFVIPGGSPAAAAVDVARTLVRRAERRVVTLHRAGELGNPEVLRYLNRLSDLLFMVARSEEPGAIVPK